MFAPNLQKQWVHHQQQKTTDYSYKVSVLLVGTLVDRRIRLRRVLSTEATRSIALSGYESFYEISNSQLTVWNIESVICG